MCVATVSLLLMMWNVFSFRSARIILFFQKTARILLLFLLKEIISFFFLVCWFHWIFWMGFNYSRVFENSKVFASVRRKFATGKKCGRAADINTRNRSSERRKRNGPWNFQEYPQSGFLENGKCIRIYVPVFWRSAAVYQKWRWFYDKNAHRLFSFHDFKFPSSNIQMISIIGFSG